MTREELRKHCEVQIERWKNGSDPSVRKIYEEHKLVLELLNQENESKKTGYWKYVQYDTNPKISNWRCSECNEIVSSKLITHHLPNYCPNCGAKMEMNIDEILDKFIKKGLENMKIDAAKKIWEICAISPGYGNAVMDIIGEEAYLNVMRLQSKEDRK